MEQNGSLNYNGGDKLNRQRPNTPDHSKNKCPRVVGNLKKLALSRAAAYEAKRGNGAP